MILKQLLTALALFCMVPFGMPSAKAQLNITELGRYDYQAERGSDLSNLWGYTDEEGNEYALVGVNGNNNGQPGGISVVDVTDPSSPVEIFFYPGPQSIWREIKVYNHHAYVTTEANSGGLTIVDLSPLPQSTNLPATLWEAPDWETSHALFIDENGILFLFGSDRGNGGAIMYDLNPDPMNPVEVGSYDQWYVHDGYARGDTLYAAHIYDGFFSMVDVSDPMNPILLGTQTTPNNFTHNVWLDDSGQHLYTTDERTDSYVGSYDVSDPTDIQFEDKLQSDPGSGTIPHNTYWLNHYLVTSYYTYGVVIYDVTHPDNMVEVGHFDTSIGYQGDGFNGDWGVYPFFPSGNLICSDIERGLYILGTDYQRGCYLEGLVTNSTTSAPIGQATVVLESTNANDITGVNGQYALGYQAAGIYQVTASAPGYVSATLNNVALSSGQSTQLDIQLEPLVPFTVQGMVTDAVSNAPIENAQVVISSDNYNFTVVSGADGMFELPGVFEGDHSVIAGAWGWHTMCPAVQSISQGSGSLSLQLMPGYADDFAVDLGWAVQNNDATSGFWERGVPVGTDYANDPCNPGVDVTGDCGEEAYVTGNGGGGAGDDDIDNGSTTLVSPQFDISAMADPYVRYKRWFVNTGGSDNPNDHLQITLGNGTELMEIENITSSTSGMGTWQQANIRILDFMAPTASMVLSVIATDSEPGHLVEGGLDVFEIIDAGSNGLSENSELVFSVFPNPNNGQFVIRSSASPATVRVSDATGREVMAPLYSANGQWNIRLGALSAGTYSVVMIAANGARSTQRIIVQP